MHFKPETSLHGNSYVMYITNFAYQNFLDLNLFFHHFIYEDPKEYANQSISIY